jgi:oxygen-independent coproporphyrinogen-3 oxidase
MEEKEIALYIHIPFCKNKCLYCDFSSFSSIENKMIDYAKALKKEIINSTKDKLIKSIFIGGGTPTYLPLDAWKIIREAIDILHKKENIEFTIEGNPGTFKRDVLVFLKDMGVNRLSIGLQAWQNSLLKKLGRIHNIDEFLQSFNLAREVGFENINIDIMFGLPNQTIEDWKETIDNVIKLSPEHISAYSLIVEEDTPFFNMYKDGVTGITEDIEREMYKLVKEKLENAEYNQYEISNFSKKGFECKHNLVYWNLESYIGCGSSAHSYNNGLRYNNEKNVYNYIEKMNKYKNAIIDKHINTEKDDIEEFMFLGLRKLDGISISEFKSRFKKDIDSVYKSVIDKYSKLQLLNINNERIKLTEQGIELSNAVMCEFILTDIDGN